MRCPYCGHTEDKVIDSRPTEDSVAVRRRRECQGCFRRFTTYEKIEETQLMVVKKDGSRQEFDKSKIVTCIMKACAKRPVSVGQAEDIAEDIEQQIMNLMKREVSSNYIGELIMSKLKELDEVAYVRFASVYKQFKDVDSFMDELKSISGSRETEN
ncbi:MAG: transcriptional repressor NrdR [Clostridia bacterium]|nr:transcriptional repressor NrdR [Clostridia bacterium]